MSDVWHEVESPGGGLGVVEARIWAPARRAFMPGSPSVTHWDVARIAIARSNIRDWWWTRGDAQEKLSRSTPRALVGAQSIEDIEAALADPEKGSGKEPYLRDVGLVALELWARLCLPPDIYGLNSSPNEIGTVTYAFSYKPPSPDMSYQILRDVWPNDLG